MLEVIYAFCGAHWLEIIGFVIGLIYLYWEYVANPMVWAASVVMPAISMFIYYNNGLYADFAINIYYLIIAIYGFIVWTRPAKKETKHQDKKEREISTTPPKVWVGVVATTLLLWVAIWWLLVKFTNSTVPIPDAFTTALSITALWMMARKYAEQWLLWLVVDMVCAALYFYKGIPFYCILYSIYTIVAYFGYRKWLQLMHQQKQCDKELSDI